MNQLVIRCVQFYLFVFLFFHCRAVPSGQRKPYHSEDLLPVRLNRPIPYQWTDDPDVHLAKKRLPIFLRTGRSSLIEDGYIDLGKNKNMNKGMWFGPRLGRTQKRDSGYDENPWAYVIFPGNPSSPQIHYTPRLGRESEEVMGETEAEIDQGIQAA